jgi:hypothetical protein
MTVADESLKIDKQELFEDLFDALAELRTGDHLGLMAQRLLGTDREYELVAFVDGGERVVFYRPRSYSLVAYPFDVGGVDESGGEVLWERVCDSTAWVDANVERVDWVHPRYRWILDLDKEQMTWAFVRTVESG